MMHDKMPMMPFEYQRLPRYKSTYQGKKALILCASQMTNVFNLFMSCSTVKDSMMLQKYEFTCYFHAM